MPDNNSPHLDPLDDAQGPSQCSGMSTTGKITVVAIIGIAVALGLFNFVYQQRRTARSVAYWGPAHRALIVGEQVEVLLLEDAATPQTEPIEGQVLQVGSRHYRVAQSKDGNGVRGLLHVRRALLDDGTYRWEPQPPAEPPVYRYALRFANEAEQPPRPAGPAAVVLFNRDGTWIQSLDRPEPLAVRNNDQGVPPFAAFLAEQFQEEKDSTRATND